MQTVGWGKQHLENFISMSSTMESISKHSLTKWYLYILRRKALINPFWVWTKVWKRWDWTGKTPSVAGNYTNWRTLIIRRDLKDIGLSWDEASELAHPRSSWSQRVAQCVFDTEWTRVSGQENSHRPQREQLQEELSVSISKTVSNGS